eukprot:5836970-Amphidinium_carterae.2
MANESGLTLSHCQSNGHNAWSLPYSQALAASGSHSDKFSWVAKTKETGYALYCVSTHSCKSTAKNDDQTQKCDYGCSVGTMRWSKSNRCASSFQVRTSTQRLQDPPHTKLRGLRTLTTRWKASTSREQVGLLTSALHTPMSSSWRSCMVIIASCFVSSDTAPARTTA